VFFFCFSLDYFVLVLCAFDVLGLVSSVLRQEIGWVEGLRNDIFCVEWDVQNLTSINQKTTSDRVKIFFPDRDICQRTGVKTRDESRHLGLD